MTGGTTVDKEALKERYRAERDKRLRPDGIGQYVRLADQLGRQLEDPTCRWSPQTRTDHVTAAFIGGGFAGLLTGARLKQAGIDDVRIVDKAGDFGGPGTGTATPAPSATRRRSCTCRCSKRPATCRPRSTPAPEILEHCRRIGKQFNLYENALFHTEVTGLRWDEAASRWIVETDRGDRFTATYLAMGTGPLHVAKLPASPASTRSRATPSTSRWDYAYTGGGPDGADGPPRGQARRHHRHRRHRRAVSPPGPGRRRALRLPADAVVGRRAGQPAHRPRLVRGDRHAGLAAGSRTSPPTSRAPSPARTWCRTAGPTSPARWRILALAPEDFTPEKMMEAFEDSDFEKMEEIRTRVDSVVDDRDTAQKLKAWYRQLCKRPCFHDEYLDAYNAPNPLVDTDGQGVERITETGVVVAGVEYPVDCIVYASGFEVGTDPTSRAGYDPVGRGGRRLSEHWASGMRSLHGVHVHGFPNMFLVQPAQGANLISNVPHNLSDAAVTIAAIVRHARRGRGRGRGHRRPRTPGWSCWGRG